MSIVKSLSVGKGDMFYIRHGSDNFSIIDCCMPEDDREQIIKEIISQAHGKGITRFISTHPDNDHIFGLEHLDDALGIRNFYCVDNKATKNEITDDFTRYCALRDSDKVFFLFAKCTRRWMNKTNDERGSAGINAIWPLTKNDYYIQALEIAANGGDPNNISPILTYDYTDGVKMLWMGDLKSEFMENIKSSLSLPKVDILFAPHHGRDSGKVPQALLEEMKPEIIIIGEAPSENLNYYQGYNTITQNSAGDITFECLEGVVHIYVSNYRYSVDFLDNNLRDDGYGSYIGSLDV